MSADDENLRRLTAQFDLLHRRLERVARALWSTEMQRDALLRSLSARSHPAASASLDHVAVQARMNRDRLRAVLDDIECLAAVPESRAAPAPTHDVAGVPESHARLMFAVLLFRDGILSVEEFQREVTGAFGVQVGGEIARIIVGATARTASRDSGG